MNVSRAPPPPPPLLARPCCRSQSSPREVSPPLEPPPRRAGCACGVLGKVTRASGFRGNVGDGITSRNCRPGRAPWSLHSRKAPTLATSSCSVDSETLGILSPPALPPSKAPAPRTFVCTARHGAAGISHHTRSGGRPPSRSAPEALLHRSKPFVSVPPPRLPTPSRAFPSARSCPVKRMSSAVFPLPSSPLPSSHAILSPTSRGLDRPSPTAHPAPVASPPSLSFRVVWRNRYVSNRVFSFVARVEAV